MIAAGLILGLVLTSTPAAKPLELSVSLRWLGNTQSVSLGTASERQLLSTYALGVGLSYSAFTVEDWAGEFEGQGELAVGWRPGPGSLMLGVGHTLAWVVPVSSWMKFSAGLRLGLWLDTGTAWASALELSVPVGVRLGPVEFIYAPLLGVPLGSDSREGFGGTLSRSITAGPSPINFLLRFHLSEL